MSRRILRFERSLTSTREQVELKGILKSGNLHVPCKVRAVRISMPRLDRYVYVKAEVAETKMNVQGWQLRGHIRWKAVQGHQNGGKMTADFSSRSSLVGFIIYNGGIVYASKRGTIDSAKFDLSYPCPKCGYRIPPTQIFHTDATHILCPACGEEVVYLKAN
jgi:predicted RNA-binding Zn-ribbon protein involved in translation (DUF1610 family)